MPASPTQRALQRCRKMGWQAWVVEKWIPQTKRRSDVWGFGDLLAVSDDGRTLLLQVTSRGGMSARRAKICRECQREARVWLRAGNAIELWGFHKVGRRWQLDRRPVVEYDLAPDAKRGME